MSYDESLLNEAGMTKSTMPEQKEFVLNNYNTVIEQAIERKAENFQSENTISENKDFVQFDIPSLQSRIKSATTSKGGLYPHEILMLDYAPTYKLNGNSFQNFWLYQYSVREPQTVLQSLVERDFLTTGDLRETIERLKVTELKEELKVIDQKVSGKKAELIDRLLEHGDLSKLEKSYPERYYKRTALGEKELKENEYIPYLHRHGYMTAWEMNYMLNNDNPLHLGYRDIIWRELNHQAETYFTQQDFGLYRNVRMYMYQFLCEEEKYSHAFYMLCEVIKYDLSGLSNGEKEHSDPYLKRLCLESFLECNFPYNESNSLIPPAIIGWAEKMKMVLNLSNDLFYNKMLENIKKIPIQRSVFTDEECVQIVKNKIENNHQNIEKIYKQAEARLKKELSYIKGDVEDMVNVPAEEPKKGPIDIIILTNQNREVEFICEGLPVINFDKMMNGDELVIGDGYLENTSDSALPEIHIALEFNPPVVNSGTLYYEEGTFEAGEKAKFEISDPPINLEEYARIKEDSMGEVNITLYFGEQEFSTQNCQFMINPAPQKEIEQLITQIEYENEKNADGPVNVLLFAKENGTFDIDTQRNPQLLYSMYSNEQEQIIGDVYVNNESDTMLENIKFEAKFTSDILSSLSIMLGNVQAGETIKFAVEDPGINVEKLNSLTEIENCIATYSLFVAGQKVGETTGKIMICPYEQWDGNFILLPAYMTPNHPLIIQVLQNAARWMMANEINPSLEGYQGDENRVKEMVEAVYHSIEGMNIIYSNPPASFFGPQRIRLCDTVIEQKFGTCMDMTILFASCLESFGLHPVLITAPSHIFAGVWLSNGKMQKEPIISDAKHLEELIRSNSLIALECTAMNAGKNIDFDKAVNTAFENICAMAENNIDGHVSIDVQLVRNLNIRPLPIRVKKGVQNIVAEQSFSNVEQLKEKAVEEKSDKNKVNTIEDNNAAVAANSSAMTSLKYTIEPYISFEEDLSFLNVDNFYDKENKKALKDIISKIIEIESPISQESIAKKIVTASNLGRQTKQFNEYLDKLIKSADAKITRQNGVRFLWKPGSEPTTYSTYRNMEQRNVEDICKYEMKNAVGILLSENETMTKDELIKGLVNMFGYNRSSKRIVDSANNAIKAARELKVIEQDEHKVFRLL